MTDETTAAPTPAAPTPAAPEAAPAVVAPATGAATAPDAPRRRRWRRVLGVVLAVVAIVAVVLFAVGAWYVQPQPLLPEATAALASTPDVTFADEPGWLSFTPTSGAKSTGLIVYQGAKVPAAGYAPTAQAIAAEGYPVFIPKMPLNFAVLGIGAADAIVAAHPEIDRWVIAGHSLGGAMATNHVASNPDTIDGLVLWASYPNADLSALPLVATSIWGSLDSGAAKMDGPEAHAQLPADATFTEIPGGNHEQMGWYTGQPNDPPATISREQQQAAVVAATVDVLDAVDAGR